MHQMVPRSSENKTKNKKIESGVSPITDSNDYDVVRTIRKFRRCTVDILDLEIVGETAICCTINCHSRLQRSHLLPLALTAELIGHS